jgi:carbon storage regulator
MLLLTRARNQSVILHTDDGLKITVTIVEAGPQGRQVKLGIEAPRSVHVDREEVFLRKQQEKAAAV